MNRLLLLSLLFLTSISSAATVSTIKPLYLIAQAVSAGIEQPQQLLADGFAAHDYALRPSERLRVQQAELVLWVGAHHESFLARILANQNNTLAMESVTGVRRLSQRDLITQQAVANTLDPHLWLAPDNAIALAQAFATKRGQQQPANAARYQANANQFRQQVQQSLQRWQARFKALPQRSYMAWHDAYQYLEQPLALSYAGSLSLSPEQKPGIKHLLTIKQQINQQHIRCILTEPQADMALVNQVSNSQTRVVAIDESLAGASSYVAGMEQMMAKIYGCMQ